MNFTLKSLLLAFGGGIVAIGCTLAGILGAFAYSDSIAPGVSVRGNSIGMLPKEDARRVVEKMAEDCLSKGIVLSCEERDWTVEPESIGLAADVEGAIESAYGIGRNGSPLQKLAQIAGSFLNGKDIELIAVYDREAASRRISDIAKDVLVQPVNASATLTPEGAILRQPSAMGKQLDQESAKEELDAKLMDFDLPVHVDMELTDQPPFVKDSDLEDLDTVLGTYTTYYPMNSSAHNIGVAAGKLNQILVRSGSGLSFNQTVGKRTYEAGYWDASVIIDGHFDVDVGGGVCQVATTLYNAVLLAGLKPVDRAPHHFPSIYVPPGRDATVADGLLDLSFSNPLPHNVYLLAGTWGNSVTVTVLGTRSDLQGNTIDLEWEGTKMKPTLYRIYERNGEVISKEFLHTDSYATP